MRRNIYLSLVAMEIGFAVVKIEGRTFKELTGLLRRRLIFKDGQCHRAGCKALVQ